MKPAEGQASFRDRNKDKLMNVQSPHKWWSILKSARGARVRHCLWGWWTVCESIGKADLRSDHFGSKQSRESVDLPFTCYPSPSLAPLP